MAPERYVIKHFYYGQFVRDGVPGGDLRVLAQTHGFSKEAIAAALQAALIPPMGNQVSGGAWAIVRGNHKEVPFVLVESELGAAGQRILHYIILPPDLLRTLNGNLRAFQPFLENPMPAYDQLGQVLKPLILADVQPPTEAQEVDDLLEFMMLTKNNLKVIQSLLASVVKGVPLVVYNAPESPEDRQLFVIGLLTLLPPSVRFAVTFATHTLANTVIDAQIRFVSSGTEDLPDNALLYDWKKGGLSGKTSDDDYSQFIVSQLRLDADLALQQARRLASIASWRVKQGDRLANALGYAAQRVTIDDSVLNNQPVEAGEVAKVLADDPTLSDDLRLAYARHLMSFSLALGELEHAEPLGVMLSRDADLAHTAYEMLQQAFLNGAAGDIFDLLTQWLKNPLGPQGAHWVKLTHESAETYLNDVLDDGEIEEAILFLKDVDRAGVAVMADKVMPRLIEVALPVAVMDKAFANTLFLMATKHHDRDGLRALLTNAQFMEQMPTPLKAFVRSLRPDANPPANVLMAAAAAFEGGKRLIMMRLVEQALAQRKYALLDVAVLRQLVKVGIADGGKQYRATLQQAAVALSDEQQLRRLDAEGRQLILSILLAIGAYGDVAKRALDQLRLFYSADAQTEFGVMLQKLFASVPVPAEEIPTMLERISEDGLRSLPLAMAYIGTLEAQAESPSAVSDAVAEDVSEMIATSESLLETVPFDAMMALLQYHMRRQHDELAIRTAGMLGIVAARYGERPASVLAKVYQRLQWSANVQGHRLDMLRVYVRHCDRSAARKVLEGLGVLLGDDVRQQLEATYILRVMMQDVSLSHYIQQVATLAAFIQDPADAYNSKAIPTQGALLNDLDSLPGGLTDTDKRTLAAQIILAGRAICHLGVVHGKVRNVDNDKRIEQLLNGEDHPLSVLEIMRVMSGYVGKGKRHMADFGGLQQNPHPLPRRTATSFLDEVKTAQSLLQAMIEATPDASRRLSAKSIHDELASLIQLMPSAEQRALLPTFAEDLQRIVEFIPHIVAKGNPRIFDDNGQGKRLEQNKARPVNVLEFYRFVSGYYLQRS